MTEDDKYQIKFLRKDINNWVRKLAFQNELYQNTDNEKMQEEILKEIKIIRYFIACQLEDLSSIYGCEVYVDIHTGKIKKEKSK